MWHSVATGVLMEVIQIFKTKLLLIPAGARHRLRSLVLFIADREAINRPKAKCFQGFCMGEKCYFCSFQDHEC